LALVPVFFYGSISFRKRPLLKTLAAIFLGLVVVAGVITGLGWLFFGHGGGLSFYDGDMSWGTSPLDFDPSILAWGFGIVYFAVLPLFFLVAGFLRLSEREVDDGVS